MRFAFARTEKYSKNIVQCCTGYTCTRVVQRLPGCSVLKVTQSNHAALQRQTAVAYVVFFCLFVLNVIHHDKALNVGEREAANMASSAHI